MPEYQTVVVNSKSHFGYKLSVLLSGMAVLRHCNLQEYSLEALFAIVAAYNKRCFDYKLSDPLVE